MLDEINAALEAYEQKWQKLIAVRHDRKFFAGMRPTAVGWKTEDREEYDHILAELHDQTDKIIETWMNGRWVAKLHLKDIRLANDATIIKVMQRRPDSTDLVGLDHVDFYNPEIKHAESHLKGEQDLKWSWESNDVTENYDWISVWFDGTEAKLKSDTVLDIISTELRELSKEITA
jgi:hypothetical protein